MAHSAVGGEIHPHGERGGGSAFEMELNNDANRGCDFKGSGKVKAALRPRQRYTLARGGHGPSAIQTLVGAPGGKSL